MKKSIFTLVFIFMVCLLSVSCTTDSYDSDLEKNTAMVHANDASVTVETDPIIIPKKD